MDAHPPDQLLADEETRPEVSRHLESCPRCRIHRRLLLVSDEPEAHQPEPREEACAEEVGTLIDDDGSGRRWFVWDDGLGRLVVHAEPTGGGQPRWFERQLDVLSQISHPHIVRHHRLLCAVPFRYVRDRVSGTHLGELDPEHDPRAAAWLAQAASGLAHLHSVGLCHGAIRPTSIRVTPNGRVLLVDVAIVESHDERADWLALCRLFSTLPGTVGDRVRKLIDALERDEVSGVDVMGWLLALRDPGAGGSSRYESRGLLGMGGMGEVRSVYDPVLDRVVAQKVLSTALLTDNDHIERFLEEACITAQLQHPGVVPVHDLEHLSSGAVAFTMKQLEGRTMAAVIRTMHSDAPSDDVWTLGRLVESLRRVCHAVAYAHDRGIVHLDLKPGNVMLGDYGEVLVFDWGLAQRLENGVARLPRPAGTPGYMAPEQQQVGDDGVVVGPAADIYAIGTMLKEVLDGELPEPGPWTPSRDAPRELVSIARRATEIDPAHRYASAQQMATDIAAWQDGLSVSAHTYAAWERAWRYIRPHQVPLAIAFVAVVLLSASGAVAFGRIQGERDRAERMLAQVLVDKANLAWDARDPVQAEAFASAAVGLTGRADARGLLARLAEGWRPRLAGRWPVSCQSLTAIDGALVCATDTEVRSWDVSTQQPLWTAPGRLSSIHRAPDGAVTGIAQNAVVRLDPATGGQSILASDSQQLTDALVLADGRLVRAHGTTVGPLAASEDAPLPAQLDGTIQALARCGADRMAAVTEPGHLFIIGPDGSTPTAPIDADRVTGPVACDARGRMLGIVSDRDVQLWTVDPPVQRHILMGHLGRVVRLEFSPDRKMLATASQDGTVRIWDVRKGEEIGRLPGHNGVRDLAFTVDGHHLATATMDQVRLWELPDKPHVGTFDVVVQVEDLHWAADGSLFTQDRLGRPAGFDPATGLQTLPVFLRVADFDTAPVGERIAFGTKAGDFGVLDLDENVFTLRVPATHAGGTTAVAWRPAAEVVVSAGRAGALRAWPTDVETDTPLWSHGVGAGVEALAWSGNGELIGALTPDGVMVVDGDTGEPVMRLPGEIRSFALGPDGDLVALAWKRGGLSLGRFSAGPQTFEALDVDGHVIGLSFSPTQPLLAAVSREGLLQVFDSRDHHELGRLFAHPAGATDVAFSPDGATLATSGARGEVVLLDSEPLLAEATGLERQVAIRYGVTRRGTELEFR